MRLLVTQKIMECVPFMLCDTLKLGSEVQLEPGHFFHLSWAKASASSSSSSSSSSPSPAPGKQKEGGKANGGGGRKSDAPGAAQLSPLFAPANPQLRLYALFALFFLHGELLAQLSCAMKAEAEDLECKLVGVHGRGGELDRAERSLGNSMTACHVLSRVSFVSRIVFV